MKKNARRVPTAPRGYALLAALIMVVMLALATTVSVEHAGLQAQRERETELLFIGQQYQYALASYYASGPTDARVYPQSLDDLLEDRRFPQARRHLRRLYPDPFTGAAWQLVRAQGRIIGVHVTSEAKPVRRTGFPRSLEGFAEAKNYAEWRFIATGLAAARAASADPPLAPPATPVEPPRGDPRPESPTPPPSNDPPGPPDPRLNRCAQEHARRIAACDGFAPGGIERRNCVLQSNRLYAACLAGR